MMNPDDRHPAGFGIHEDIFAGLHRFSHAAMATLFEIYCAHPGAEYARQAAASAFGLADRLEQELSRFVENSDISRINRLAAGESALVSPSTMECLQIASAAYLETHGIFDISLGSGFENLELAPGDLTVRAHADEIRLDLGGIGKGYAIDRMAEELADWEVYRALIHAGFSSVFALEPPQGRRGWPLTLSMPVAGEVLARISVRGQALSGSGIRKGDHIIDPRKMQPVRFRPAAWVSAPRDILGRLYRRTRGANGFPDPLPVLPGESPAAVADALSTAFMILSAEEIGECCGRHAGLEAWILEGPSQQPDSAPALVHFPATRA